MYYEMELLNLASTSILTIQLSKDLHLPKTFRQRSLAKSLPTHVLIYGEGKIDEDAAIDHGRKLKALLERCHERGLKLNKDKLRLQHKEEKFEGHPITAEGLIQTK